MCPAFGSLRVGLRMRRTATILSGSACCVYGLTFTSHFYGARRSVGYVPFNSESLVTGKLFEDIREAVHAQADPTQLDAIVIINLCVPTASGVPLQLLPTAINGVRIIGIDVPGFGVPTHAEAKDVLTGAMLKYARQEIMAGPVPAPRQARSDKPTITLLGEMFPADPMLIAQMIAPMDLAVGTVAPTREWRELYAALDGAAVAAIHPFYTASIREFEAAGRPIVGSAPVGVDGTHDWLGAIGQATGVAQAKIDTARNATLAAIRGVLSQQRIQGRITLSGYEGSELLVGRLLVECGADLRYVGIGLPGHAVERARRRVAARQGRAGAVPRLAGKRPRRAARIPAAARHRHHAGGAGRQGSLRARAVLHQPDFGAPPDGRGRRRFADPGDQRRHGQPGALRRDERLLRQRRPGRQGRRVGRRAPGVSELPQGNAAAERKSRQEARGDRT